MAAEVVVVVGWLIVLTVVALGILLLLVKRRGGGHAGHSRDLVGNDTSKNVGERWRDVYPS